MLKVTRGERPSRPLGLSYVNRGLTNFMWRLMEDCLEHVQANRPTVSQIVVRLPTVPDNRPNVLWVRFRAPGNYEDSGLHDLSVVRALRVRDYWCLIVFVLICVNW